MEYLAFVSVITLVGWYFSQNAKNTIPRLLFVIVGIYLLTDDLYVYRYLGLGFILAQVFFIIRYIKYQYMIFRIIGFSGYYLGLSIYYKFLNFLNWFKSLFKAISIFFTSFDFSSAKSSYTKDNPKEEKQDFDYEKYEEAKEQYEQKDEAQFTGKYAQFNSKDPYIILGVSRSDSLATINKAKKKLMREHHPDLNADRVEEATIIFQIINNAYDEIEKIHKG
jgi:hypothetical protein